MSNITDERLRRLPFLKEVRRYIRHDDGCPALWSDKNVFNESRDNRCICRLDDLLLELLS
jgi:hypothetical protein